MNAIFLGQPRSTQPSVPRSCLRDRLLPTKSTTMYGLSNSLVHPDTLFCLELILRHKVYALAKELYPGKYRPTISHAFIKLLADKNLLKMCFTQNIDTLERRAGVPVEKIIEAHGSFASQHCIDCGKSYPDDKIKRFVQEGNIPHCKKCDGLVKPDIVFFGESVSRLRSPFVYTRPDGHCRGSSQSHSTDQCLSCARPTCSS